MLMKRQLTIIITSILLTLTFQSKADSWVDPTWKEMLDSSDVIALIQYTSNGDFRASAKIQKIYKGQLNIGDEIWISGFSNRYGPIDKMKKGDKYLVFINLAEPTEKRIEYWNEELLKKPELKDYVEALKNKKAFYVWSPTAGDLKIRRKKVQYDLIQTTFYEEQEFYSLPEFEYFIQSYNAKTLKNKLSKELLDKINPASESDISSQDLMKLYLLQYDEYDNIFEKYAKVENPSSKFALALLMGNINNEQSKQVLLTLLEDKHTLVQGEAVRQLSKDSSSEVGAILLKQLKNANPGNFGSSNIMNPVMNRIDGGKSQIIETLGEIGYKLAIPELLSMLDTKDYDEFNLIVKTLRKLETREYASYINKHLDNLDNEMVLQLCYIIKEDSLTDCIPSLMNYVKRHDRTVYPTKECTISKYYGLAHFPTDTVKQFLYADFIELMKMPNTNKESIDTKQKWVNEYLLSFIDLGMSTPKNQLYDFMYDYYGFNVNFKMDSTYFQKKHEIEDSLVKIVLQILKPLEPDVQVTAIAFLDNDFKLINYSVKYQIPKPEKFEMWGKNRLDTLNQAIINNCSIDKKHLIWSTENYSGSDGATSIKQFGDYFMDHFLDYISTFADKEDILFIENLKKYNYPKNKELDSYLLKAKMNYGQ